VTALRRRIEEGAEPSPPTLAVQAYQLLEELIVTARLKPGAVVSEASLGRQLGIGRMPIREAIKRLDAEGLLVVLPQRGVLVSPIDAGQFRLQLETRRPIDRLLAESAARRATRSERDDFRHLADEIVAAAARDDVDGFLARDRAFDQLVASACRNPFTARAAAQLHAHSRRFWHAYRDQEDLAESAAHHAGLMRAVADEGAEAASAASDRLIDYLDAFAQAAFGRS
jgi:DNA-binding GntR family transcriptional regulator